MYCLSSTLKHCEPAVLRFSSLDGYSQLLLALHDPSQTIRTKTSFLLSQLVSQSAQPLELSQQLRQAGVLKGVLDSLDRDLHQPTESTGENNKIDEDYRDKSLRFLVNVVERTEGKGLEKDEKDKLGKVVKELEEGGEWSAEEDLGMAKSEWEDFKRSFKQ